ncbi:MAG: hydroxymethylglutaryl-CoA lyase [Pseudomonadota bacterium]
MTTACVREVGLRDGLQLTATRLDTETKLEWIRRQAAAGFREIEVTSFVPPKLLPQFADAAEVVAGANAVADLTAVSLVLNLKGAERAIAAGARHLTYVVSASEAHSQSNVRCSTDEAVARFPDIVALSREHGAFVGAAISTSFGCSLQGHVAPEQVLAIVAELSRMGAGEITLADTVGYASPTAVSALFTAAAGQTDGPLAAHFHDTRGLGLANVVAAADAGVRHFDASLGGLGGCPFAPGASGNIATEDCVYLLENLGLATGVDIDAMLAVRNQLDRWLPGETLYGKLALAGPARTFAVAAAG